MRAPVARRHVAVRRAPETRVTGLRRTTPSSRGALDAIAAAAGGGSASRRGSRSGSRWPRASAAELERRRGRLRLANELLDTPLEPTRSRRSPRRSGRTCRSSSRTGAQLATGDGTTLEPIELPRDYFVVLALPNGAAKASTAAVYARSTRGTARTASRIVAPGCSPCSTGSRTARDLAALPPNDLASSPLADELRRVGAFRADVSGAGPVVYGLFATAPEAATCSRGARGQGARSGSLQPG